MQVTKTRARTVDIMSNGTERMFPPDQEMAELLLLLPSEQAAALERAAWQQSLTVAQVLRQLVWAFLGCQARGVNGLLPVPGEVKDEDSRPGNGNAGRGGGNDSGPPWAHSCQ